MDPIGRVGSNSTTQAKPADELAVVDGETAKGRFRHPRVTAEFGDVAQQRLAHPTISQFPATQVKPASDGWVNHNHAHDYSGQLIWAGEQG
jgi:hypothetical protein